MEIVVLITDRECGAFDFYGISGGLSTQDCCVAWVSGRVLLPLDFEIFYKRFSKKRFS